MYLSLRATLRALPHPRPTYFSSFTEFIFNTPSFSVLPCFSSGTLEVTFLFGSITDDVINLREAGTGGVLSISEHFRAFYWNPQEEIRVTLEPSAHICTCDVWVPEITPSLYVSRGSFLSLS